MLHLSTLRGSLLGIAGALVLIAVPVRSNARTPDGGRGVDAMTFADRMSLEQDQLIGDEIRRNETLLAKAGRLPKIGAKIAGLRWPLAPTPGVGIDWHGVSNFVDLNAAFPNQVRDYTCAARSYDNADGYNHRGTDIFIWPFAWDLLDAGAVDIVAAAAGTIIAKADGNNDRSCSFDAPDTPNYVAVRHDDGTVLRYLHMKTGSTTPKAVGSTVAVGEYLGKVGSSGVSTGPHLHFELRASSAANAAVIDPFNGACNTVASAWASQRPYRDPHVNRLTTHSAPPVVPQCPNTTDVANLSDRFDPGALVTVLAAYRDQGRGQHTTFRILRPDSTVFMTWNFDSADVSGSPEYYSASYWYWTHRLPASAPLGEWIFESRFEGETGQKVFRVGAAPVAIVDMRGLTGAWFEPATSGQGFELQWIEPERLLVFFYGHHDDGQNFFLVGTRDGRFGYGETIEIPLVITRGGRFNGLIASNIHNDPWGTLRLTFPNCSSATAVLTGTDGTQTMTLTRLTLGPGLRCE